jgi:creatinine amidohydrolase
MKRLALTILLSVVGMFFGARIHRGTNNKQSRIMKLEDLDWVSIDKLDRTRTVFFLTFGNLEEHGPHLPVGSDYFQALALRDGLVARLQKAYPDYRFVLFPVVPIGEGGANQVAMQYDHVGTFSVRPDTLRDVAIDLGGTIARMGFQNIFLIHFHGGPLHNIALTEASAFVSERYKARMVNVTSLVYASGWFDEKVMEKYLGKNWQDKIGWEGHAGAAETSTNLYLRPDLVKRYTNLPPFVAKNYGELFDTSEKSGWQGYWGAPALASPQLGEDLMNEFIDRAFRIAQMSLNGQDLSSLPIFPYNQPPVKEAGPRNKMVADENAKQAAEIAVWVKEWQARKH